MSESFHTTGQHIIDTAKPIILGKGFTAVGLNEILKAANVPKGSFYHYFKSKEQFGEAMLEDFFSRHLVIIDNILNNEQLTGAQRLTIYWQAWFDANVTPEIQCPCLAVKLAAEVSDLSEAMRLSLQKGTDQIVKKIATCIQIGMNDGSLAIEVDAPQTALMLYQMWFGASILSKIHRSAIGFNCVMLATKSILKLK